MLKLKSSIRAKIEMPEGHFFVEFKRLKQNFVEEWRREVSLAEKLVKEDDSDEARQTRDAKVLELFKAVVVGIEGLEDEEGEITVERFISGDIYNDLQRTIANAYFEHQSSGKKNI
jgi:hypothetical protein